MATQEEQNPRKSGLGIGGWLREPENRAALLQASLSMLTQPSGNILGAVGQAVGEGAEARDRSIMGTLKQDEAALDNQLKTRKVDIEDRRLDLLERKGIGGGGGGRTWSQMMTNDRANNTAFTKFLQVQAKAKAAENFTDEDTELAAMMNDPVILQQSRQQFQNIYGGNGNPAAAAVMPPGVSPTPAPTGGIPEGRTATNPQTGQKVIYRGGKWEPL